MNMKITVKNEKISGFCYDCGEKAPVYKIKIGEASTNNKRESILYLCPDCAQELLKSISEKL